MKKLLSVLLLYVIIASTTNAKDIKIIVANAPGSTSDIIAKALGDSFKEITGDNFKLEYHPGASGSVAAVKFQSANKESVLVGITSLHIYGPILEKDLPYKDNDFIPISIIGFQPGIYISDPASGINNIEDLINKLSKSNKPFIGGYAATYNLSVEILKNAGKLEKNVEIVGHKSAPDIILNVLNGTISVGVVATTGNLYQLAKEGKINIIGSTADDEFVYEGVKVPSITKALGIPQTKGGILLSLKPDADKEFIEKFIETLKKAMETDRVKEAMYKTNISPAGVIGIKETSNKISNMRKDVLDIMK